MRLIESGSDIRQTYPKNDETFGLSAYFCSWYVWNVSWVQCISDSIGLGGRRHSGILIPPTQMKTFQDRE